MRGHSPTGAASSYRVEVAVEAEEAALAGRLPVSPPTARPKPAKAPALEADSADRQRLLQHRDDLRRRLRSLGSTIKVYAGTFSEPGRPHILRRGDPTQKLEPVGASSVKAIKPSLDLPPATREADRRLARSPDGSPIRRTRCPLE